MYGVENIILQHSTRGMDKLFEYQKIPFYKNASESFMELPRGVVFIYTGFWVNGMGETDGPVGAYFLYKALNDLGFCPIIITDKYCLNFFKTCAMLQIDVGFDTVEYFKNILNHYNPVAHISIERLGRDINKCYKNAKGVDISPYTSKLDELYEMAHGVKYAIGDGGNEIGMGNFYDFLQNTLHVNACIVKCDFAMIASVSNWGAYGFIASLQMLSKINILPTFDEVENFLEHIVKCGANEGFSGENIMSVDAKGYLIDRQILNQLKAYLLQN